MAKTFFLVAFSGRIIILRVSSYILKTSFKMDYITFLRDGGLVREGHMLGLSIIVRVLIGIHLMRLV
jgi:hypothetical protein